MNEDGMAEHSVEALHGKKNKTTKIKKAVRNIKKRLKSAEVEIEDFEDALLDNAEGIVANTQKIRALEDRATVHRKDIKSLSLRMSHNIANWREWGHGMENRMAGQERASGAGVKDKEPMDEHRTLADDLIVDYSYERHGVMRYKTDTELADEAAAKDKDPVVLASMDVEALDAIKNAEPSMPKIDIQKFPIRDAPTIEEINTEAPDGWRVVWCSDVVDQFHVEHNGQAVAWLETRRDAWAFIAGLRQMRDCLQAQRAQKEKTP